MGCNTMICSRDELFVLCCLWDCRAYLRLFLGGDPGLVFNINYCPEDCRGAILSLYSHGLIEWSVEGGEVVDIKDGLRNDAARDVSNGIVIGLTEMGGCFFEDYFDIDWGGYVSEVFIEADGGVIKASGMVVLGGIFDWIEKKGVYDFFDFTIDFGCDLIYWKKISCFNIHCFRRNSVIDGYELLREMIDVISSNFDSLIAGKIRNALK